MRALGLDPVPRHDLRLAAPAAAAWIGCALALGTSGRTALIAAAGLAAAAGAAAGTGLAAGTGHANRSTGAGRGFDASAARAPGRRPAASVVAAALLCAAAGAAVVGIRLTALAAGPVPRLAASGAPVGVELVLAGDPEVHPARVRGSALGSDLVVVPARVTRVTVHGSSVRVRTPIVVLATGPGWTDLLPSQRVAAAGRLAPPRRGELVGAVLMARAPPQVLSSPSPVQGVAGRIRAGLRTASRVLPPESAGLLPGLVIGDTSRLGPDLREDFRTTGMSHLVAVSGANVAIVLGAVLVLARWLRLGPRAGPALAGLALVGFVVLARPSPSVLRAAAMGVVVVLALASGRPRAALPALLTAVTVLLLVEPALSRSIGFALSVAATAGLLILAPPWRARLARRLPGWVADAIAVPLAAQCACAPLIAAISAAVSLVAVPANLLAAPAVVPATLLGVLAALTAPVSAAVGEGLVRLAGVPTGFLVWIAHTGARLPGAALPWPGGRAGAVGLAVVSGVVGLGVTRRAGRRLLAAALVGLLFAITGVRTVAPAWPPHGWQLVACDVGQGDALVLAGGTGTAVVVDAGPEPAPLAECLRSLRVRSVPLVVLTHLHADHVEGLPAVLRGYGVREVEIGPLDAPAEELRRISGWAHRAGATVTRAVAGEARSLGPIRWRVLAPLAPFIGTNSDPNNNSLVLAVQLVGFTALLTGDVEPPAQRALLERPEELRTDVVKVPHHGSDHQEGAFLDAAAAAVALTSVGADNTYGHPSSRTLRRLAAAGTRSFRTDRDGSVALVGRSGGVTAVGRRGSGTPPSGHLFRSRGQGEGQLPAVPAAAWGEAGSRPAARPWGLAMTTYSGRRANAANDAHLPYRASALSAATASHRRAAPSPAARAPPPV